MLNVIYSAVGGERKEFFYSDELKPRVLWRVKFLGGNGGDEVQFGFVCLLLLVCLFLINHITCQPTEAKCGAS